MPALEDLLEDGEVLGRTGSVYAGVDQIQITSVVTHGATGDGSTDDTAAFVAATTACPQGVGDNT